MGEAPFKLYMTSRSREASAQGLITVQITHKLNNTRVLFTWRGCCFCYTRVDNFKSTRVYTHVQSLHTCVYFSARVCIFPHTCAIFRTRVLQSFSPLCVYLVVGYNYSLCFAYIHYILFSFITGAA